MEAAKAAAALAVAILGIVVIGQKIAVLKYVENPMENVAPVVMIHMIVPHKFLLIDFAILLVL